MDAALSYIRESIEKYHQPVSEQRGEGWPDAAPTLRFTMEERVAALGMAVKRVNAIVGSAGGPSAHEWALHALKHARACNLPARLYELAWFISQTAKPDHVILDNGVNPANAWNLP